MEDALRIRVSRYVSYVLRHNPEGLEMDGEGFVDLDGLVVKVRRRFPSVDRSFLLKMVDEGERTRFEIVGGKIRALYGHTIAVHIGLEEDKQIARLYHGTTSEAAKDILQKGFAADEAKVGSPFTYRGYSHRGWKTQNEQSCGPRDRCV